MPRIPTQRIQLTVAIASLLISTLVCVIGRAYPLRVFESPRLQKVESPPLRVGSCTLNACTVRNVGRANASGVRIWIKLQPEGPFELSIVGGEGQAVLEGNTVVPPEEDSAESSHASGERTADNPNQDPGSNRVIHEGEVVTINEGQASIYLDRLVATQSVTVTVRTTEATSLACSVNSDDGPVPHPAVVFTLGWGDYLAISALIAVAVMVILLLLKSRREEQGNPRRGESQ